MKFLLLLLVIGVVAWLFSTKLRRRLPEPPEGAATPPSAPAASSADRAAPKASASTASSLTQEPMVACAQCDLHLPRSEALWLEDQPFCSEAHRLAQQKPRASE